MKTTKPTSTKLRTRALALLARRDYSRAELQQKLAAELPADEVDAEAQLTSLLDEFCQQGWLSDTRVVQQLVNKQRPRYGSLRIAHNLRQKGIDETELAEVLPELQASELEAARQVWQKKFGTVATEPKEKARQIRFLQSRGFSLDVIFKIIKPENDAV